MLIEVFDDRVEILNPGGLPSGLKPSDFGRKSVARNPLIASLLNRINYIEKVGTGINLIKQAVAENERSSVKFHFDSGFSVVFRRLEITPEMGLGEKWGEKQLEIILEILNDSQISIVTLSQKIGLGTTAVENNIAKFKEKGILNRVGPTKGGHWEVDPELAAALNKINS